MALRNSTTVARFASVLALALGLALHVAPVSATPTTLGFDDILSQPADCNASTPASSGVPSPYGGLNWSTLSGGFPVDVVGLECDAHYQGPAYEDTNGDPNTYGAPSPDFAAYNSQGFGEILVAPVSGTFDFFGAKFSSFVFGNGVLGYDPFSAYSVRLEGYQGNVLAFSTELDLYSDNGTSINPASYITLAVNWPGLTALGIFAGNGVIADSLTFGEDGRSFLVDDVTVMLNPIPEPGTALLLLVGLVGLARNRNRRRI